MSPDLKIGVTELSFQISGYTPSDNDLLKMINSGKHKTDLRLKIKNLRTHMDQLI